MKVTQNYKILIIFLLSHKFKLKITKINKKTIMIKIKNHQMIIIANWHREN